ncbi:hypothetical protein [Fibrella aquatica]|jgi:hypothetical protein|uniref:hypothetical protein n=1 Tax=Fibrella aquatica TaxID=3242487 RepID=UPI00351FBF81
MKTRVTSLLLLLATLLAKAQSQSPEPKDFATVIVYRPNKLLGVFNNIWIGTKHEKTCRLSNNRFTEFKVLPGDVMLHAKSGPDVSLPSRRQLLFPVESGKTYYVKVTPQVFALNMAPVESENAQKELRKTKLDRCADTVQSSK